LAVAVGFERLRDTFIDIQAKLKIAPQGLVSLTVGIADDRNKDNTVDANPKIHGGHQAGDWPLKPERGE
jgi:hypothetical protein